MIKTISAEVKNVLEQCTITDKVLFLPQGQLERELYNQVNDVLVGLGAKWDKKNKGHLFEYPITAELNKVIETSEYTNWKKETDYFHTPKEVVLEMLGSVGLAFSSSITILEPSAGIGHILDIAKEEFYNANFIYVEMNPNHCEKLRQKGYDPIQSKFEDTDISGYDLVLMNPPFTYQCEHIQKAYEGLKKGGILVSIASSSIIHNTRGKEKKFKEWLEDVVNKNGCWGWNKLRANIFKESGTSVDTIMIVIEKEYELL